jgi:hypothetical protein
MVFRPRKIKKLFNVAKIQDIYYFHRYTIDVRIKASDNSTAIVLSVFNNLSL